MGLILKYLLTFPYYSYGMRRCYDEQLESMKGFTYLSHA